MTAMPPETSVLLTQVRQFTSELLRWTRTLAEQFPGDVPDAGEGGLVSDEAALWRPQAMQARAALLGLLERQANRMQDLGGTQGLAMYREAQYVMAVLADELMLNTNWQGRYQWHLLENELFRSHAAGDIFFERLDRLLAPAVLSSRELAIVYLQALALDFRGRYRGADPQHRLERYRRQIYVRVFGHQPEQEAQARLFPASYSTEIDDEPQRLSSAHVWWWNLAAIVAMWLLISSLLWQEVATPVDKAAQRIERFGTSAGQVAP